VAFVSPEWLKCCKSQMHPACIYIFTWKKVDIKSGSFTAAMPTTLNIHPSQHVHELLISDPPTNTRIVACLLPRHDCIGHLLYACALKNSQATFWFLGSMEKQKRPLPSIDHLLFSFTMHFAMNPSPVFRFMHILLVFKGTWLILLPLAVVQSQSLKLWQCLPISSA